MLQVRSYTFYSDISLYICMYSSVLKSFIECSLFGFQLFFRGFSSWFLCPTFFSHIAWLQSYHMKYDIHINSIYMYSWSLTSESLKRLSRNQWELQEAQKLSLDCATQNVKSFNSIVFQTVSILDSRILSDRQLYSYKYIYVVAYSRLSFLIVKH